MTLTAILLLLEQIVRDSVTETSKHTDAFEKVAVDFFSALTRLAC